MNRETKELLLLGGGVIGLFAAGAAAVWMIYFRSGLEVRQIGYAGVGMQTVAFTADVEAAAAALDPAALEQVYELEPDDGSSPRAGEIYENVQVLGHLSDGNFNRIMTQITEWVAPEQGCGYCHNNAQGEVENFASDWNYAKVVSRRMFQMTQTINAQWSSHVGQTGVTCYTCHRGMNVPANLWFQDPASEASRAQARFIGELNGQNRAVAANGYTDLNVEPFSAYMLGDKDVRVQATAAIDPSKPNPSLQDTEATYALMMHWSTALGVNCTYCHNSRAFSSWEQSPPARATAWHGRRMAAALNVEYLNPLQPVYPAHRLGPLGDAPKLNCATCHQGQNKPLGGAAMAANYPSLLAPGAAENQDQAYWPTTGGPAPEGWPETGRYRAEGEAAAAGAQQ